MNTWHLSEGWLDPPGVSWVGEQEAWNFVLYSMHAERVVLLLYGPHDARHPILTHELDLLRNKSGPVWHCRIPRRLAREATYYAYRVFGPAASSEHWHRFDPEKILLDPYARAVHFPAAFDRAAACRTGPNDGRAPLGVLETDAPFDWGDDRTIRHGSDLVIYEMHVRGFSRDESSGVSQRARGTFAGVIEKIPYLKDLGVTAVELMPIFQFDPQEGNYWGYMPLNFFAPHHAYGSVHDPSGLRNEFRRMVRALHEAGIEVILDVVYNHTAEGDHRWPTYSFKGIDNSLYYIRAHDPEKPYADFTGCKNTLDASSGLVRKLIIDSLRHWYEEMHVDGFRFDLASIFARRSDGTIDREHPPIFGQIVSRQGLLNIRLIGEPWDAAGTHQLGRDFPGWLWMQWNGLYRDAVQRFVRGDEGIVAEFMARLYGSRDVFPDDRLHAFRPWQSVNYVTSHDGFSLYDLVSYTHKRNQANGQGNTDGWNDFSANCGVEGDEGLTAEIAALRRRQARNFFCLLLLSNGSPMFRMGDEFLQTQGGNNNPFNQDNRTSWLDWRKLDENQAFFRFVRLMIAFRKDHPSIARSTYWGEDVRWYGSSGAIDSGPQSRHFAYYLDGASCDDGDLYVMINMEERDREFLVQEGPVHAWRRAVDTARESPDDIREPGTEVPLRTASCTVAARSVLVLLRPPGAARAGANSPP